LSRQAGNAATAKEPALLIGVQSQFVKILTQLKEKFVVESAKIGFNEVFIEVTRRTLFFKGCVVIA